MPDTISAGLGSSGEMGDSGGWQAFNCHLAETKTLAEYVRSQCYTNFARRVEEWRTAR
jgi:hypothetical protein